LTSARSRAIQVTPQEHGKEGIGNLYKHLLRHSLSWKKNNPNAIVAVLHLLIWKVVLFSLAHNVIKKR
jgi:hypothetical protein